MAYAPITKIEKFTGKKDDTQVWLNDVKKAIIANRWNDACALQAIPYFLQNTANSWYQSLINKPQDFAVFKQEFLQYFNNNNSINHLANTFISIRQGETEAVTTYLGCFHYNLRQIQAIDINYFTVPQILNQFIHSLYSSILQCVCSLHPANLQAAVTHAQDFKLAKLEANHAQAINLAINGSSKLDSKLKQFIGKSISKPQLPVPNFEFPAKSRTIPTLTSLCANDTATNLSTTNISSPDLSSTATSNILTTTTNNLSTPNGSDTATKLPCQWSPKAKNHPTKLAIVNSSPSTNLQLINPTIRISSVEFGHQLSSKPKFPALFNNIPPATVTKNQFLAAIFSFEFEELSNVPLFSGAALNEKPITAMYTNAKVDGQSIKLILDNQLGCQVDHTTSTRIITVNGTTKTPIGEIDDFPFNINGIVTSIKVLVMKTTQYQALVDNDWLSKANATLDWNTQELQLAFNGQHTWVPATCGHFKVSSSK
ncbi:hypothetical protein G9A89_007845 [Geosiphon pyriformis]|nr:hypothetical protein G9A89_007845 [Geosiphon pyriformis]